jgi:hypothetical protein
VRAHDADGSSEIGTRVGNDDVGGESSDGDDDDDDDDEIGGDVSDRGGKGATAAQRGWP